MPETDLDWFKAFLAAVAYQGVFAQSQSRKRLVAGERTKLQVAHVKLCYSRAFILRAYPQQTHEMLFDAHNHAFRVLGGVPRWGIYDNMRTAGDKIGRGKERQVNARFSAMVSVSGFEDVAAVGEPVEQRRRHLGVANNHWMPQSLSGW